MPEPPYKALFTERAVPPPLAGLVTRITGYAEAGAGLNHSVEIASLTVPLIINFGSPFAIALHPGHEPENTGSFISGLHPGIVDIISDGLSECVQVNFTPAGARRFFRLPMHELRSRLVPVADLESRALNALASRLSSTACWEERLDLVTDFIEIRLLGHEYRPQRSAPAFAMLAGSRGRIPVQKIADEMGWSRKRLIRVFDDEIGAPPKLVGRIIRFQHAVERLAQPRKDDLADVAAECGFSDQAHMSREFSLFAGAPPARWLITQA